MYRICYRCELFDLVGGLIEIRPVIYSNIGVDMSKANMYLFRRNSYIKG